VAVEQQVSKSRFKARALEYLRHVQETGQSVIILDRGRPALKIVRYGGEAQEILRLLRGSVKRYDDPTRPVAAKDWEALR
jgi:antitoxin (DNA-binding transcriptional repressor) of toxin-antitoxin stability system